MTVNKEFSQALNIVEKLNDELFKLNDKNYFIKQYEAILEFCSNGYAAIINFSNIEIWNSEEDIDRYDEETYEDMGLEKYIRAKLKVTLEQLSNIKIDGEIK